MLAYRKAKKPLAPRHLFEVTLDEEQLRRLRPEELPDGWNSYPHPNTTQRLGDAWVRAGEAVGLAVPSVLAPPEVNVMLNCQHPDFAVLTISSSESFPIDPRLAPETLLP